MESGLGAGLGAGLGEDIEAVAPFVRGATGICGSLIARVLGTLTVRRGARAAVRVSD